MIGLSPAMILSQILGWVYTIAWSLSFWPQLLLNFKRRSVQGLSLDFLALNPLGFACLSAFNMVLYTSHTVRREYKDRHDGHAPQVRPNDVAFAVHALLVSSATLFQAIYYRHTIKRSLSTYNRIFISLALLSIAVLVVLASSTSKLAWLDLLYLLSYIKLYISTAKYIPQAYLNYQRKSTSGWSIENILLDFTGGVLSLAQLVLDSWIASDWTAITGNPGKLGLSFLSIAFDILFMLQHYVFYKGAALSLLESGEADRSAEDEGSERERLLRNS